MQKLNEGVQSLNINMWGAVFNVSGSMFDIHDNENVVFNTVERSKGNAVAEASTEPGTKAQEATPSFHSIIQYEDADMLLRRLHQLIDGRRGADVGSVLLKCLLDGYIGRRPTQREFEEEFQLIGGWRAIHKYMDDNNENALIRSNKVIIF